MIMFDHAVKYRGKYYPANTPIEEPAQVETVEEPAQVETVEEAAQEAPVAEAEEMPAEKQEAPKKAARSRKKGDA